MNLQEKILRVNKIEDLPTLQEIKSIPRGLNLKIIFEGKTTPIREEVGQSWKNQLPKFQIGIHTNGQEINILKLISDEEIIQNQLFFENCAKEYGILGEKLITQFIDDFKVPQHVGFPLETLNPWGKKFYKPNGKMGNWKYDFHGFHCAFTHNATGQQIEVPLIFGEEYGELDPYFFSNFIKTTPKFRPLPIQIFSDYSDGKRILEVMLKLGRFEEINSNLKGEKGVIVKDREKKEIKIFNQEMGKGLNDTSFKGGNLNFWNRLKRKI